MWTLATSAWLTSHLLLGGLHSRVGGRDLRFGDQVFAMGVVDFLLGDQAGTLLGDVVEALVVLLGDVVSGFRAGKLVLGLLHVGLAAFDGGIGAAKVVLHFGNFEGGEELTLWTRSPISTLICLM